MTADFTKEQMNRGALVGALLDINLDQWHDKLRGLSDEDIPSELHDALVQMVGSLMTSTNHEHGSVEDLDARGDYLQGIASMSDAALRWVVETFGKMPEVFV